MAAWALLPENLGGLHEVYGVVVVFRHTSCNCQDIYIKNNILWWEINLLSEDLEGSLTDADFVLGGGSLTFLIESHYDDGGSISQDGACLLLELIWALLERDRVHNCLSLAVLESSLNYFKLGGIDHDWNLRDIWVGECHPHEPGHRLLAIDEAVIEVEVEDLGAVLYLFLGNSNSVIIFIVFD